MTGQGKNPGKAKVTFYVLELKVEGSHLERGTGTITAV